jgi:hypothetical protein
MMMEIRNLVGNDGDIPNQYLINDGNDIYYKSYDTIIIKITYINDKKTVYLSREYWNFSKTTNKYRNLFLGKTTKEIQELIKSGEYILTELN